MSITCTSSVLAPVLKAGLEKMDLYSFRANTIEDPEDGHVLGTRVAVSGSD